MGSLLSVQIGFHTLFRFPPRTSTGTEIVNETRIANRHAPKLTGGRPRPFQIGLNLLQ